MYSAMSSNHTNRMGPIERYNLNINGLELKCSIEFEAFHGINKWLSFEVPILTTLLILIEPRAFNMMCFYLE